MSWHSSRRDIL